MFSTFSTKELLEKHRIYCYTGNPETLVPCVDRQYHVFEKWQATQRLPYIIYADVECFLENVNLNDGSQITKQHKAAAIGYLLVPHPTMKAKPLESKYQVFQGEQCVLHCMQSIQETAMNVYNWNKANSNQRSNLTHQDKVMHYQATNCIIC